MTNDAATKREKEVEMKRRRAQSWISQLTKEQMADIEESFRFFDKDGSGSIDTSELEAAMKSLGVAPNEAELTRMIEEVDIDGDGNIDFDEFLGMMAKKMVNNEGDDGAQAGVHGGSSQNIFERAFKVFDSDGDGFITSADLKRLMSTMGEDCTEDEISDMIKVADVDGDGRVNYHEFLKIVEDTPPAPSSNKPKQQKSANDEPPLSHQSSGDEDPNDDYR